MFYNVLYLLRLQTVAGFSNWLGHVLTVSAVDRSPRYVSKKFGWQAVKCTMLVLKILKCSKCPEKPTDIPDIRMPQSFLRCTDQRAFEDFQFGDPTMYHGVLDGKTSESETLVVVCVLYIIEGSLEAKLPTIWRDENAVQLRRSSEMEKVRREKMQVREKVGKSRNTVFSNVLWLRRVEK